MNGLETLGREAQMHWQLIYTPKHYLNGIRLPDAPKAISIMACIVVACKVAKLKKKKKITSFQILANTTV